jgi:kanamycin kinase
MKKTLLQTPPQDLPERFISFIEGAKIYDSSCSREARVYFIDKDDGYYLKTSAKGTLKTEAEMTAFFNTKGLAAGHHRYGRH